MAINNKTDNIISKTSIIPKLKILLQYVFFNVYPQKKAVDKTPKNTEPENLILSNSHCTHIEMELSQHTRLKTNNKTIVNLIQTKSKI